ncbi:hypothetical protein FKP32DRAFT_1278778 [Trametes sanguinea]|nr:hypothetical protein FKP32DRAFT_1278778 [Trametes sanguinea]
MGHLLTVRAHLAAQTEATSKSSPGTASATETHAQGTPCGCGTAFQPRSHAELMNHIQCQISPIQTLIPPLPSRPYHPAEPAPVQVITHHPFLLARLRLPGLLPLLGSSLAQDAYE